MELTEVKGIGPATAIKLKAAGINTAEELANASIDDLVAAGIRKPTATKLVNNANEVVGTSSDKPKSEEKPAKAPKQTSKQPKPKDDSKGEIKAVKIPISYVKGVGPKTRNILEDAEITSAQALASQNQEDLVELGIGKATAAKIIANAIDQIGVLPGEEKAPAKKKKAEKVVTETKPEAEPKPKKEKKPEAQPAEHERSPIPQGIPTKKKRGIQIRKASELEEPAEVADVEKPTGWGVQAKELSKDDIERRKARQEEIARSRQITRPIPLKPEPVKAVKTEKAAKTTKPQKVDKSKKKVKLSKKQTKQVIEYFKAPSVMDQTEASRKRGISGKAGTAKPRIVLERDTFLGKITSHRRSRRVVHYRQVIVKLDNGYKPDQLVGQKVYFRYPETTAKVPGSIGKRFGKASSGKVLVYFKKGIRQEALNQKIFIK